MPLSNELSLKTKINAQQFLLYVAYGEQSQAEQLLKKSPRLAQELLRANNIPFTDYSGRTFTCTAYEYAYWAKDAHMLKMLEKYIQQNEETRQFIVDRVEAIEKPVRQASSSCFSKFFVSSQSKPKGLHYTTKNSDGQTIDHWEAHFDLTPLKKALQAYRSQSDRIAHYNIRVSAHNKTIDHYNEHILMERDLIDRQYRSWYMRGDRWREIPGLKPYQGIPSYKTRRPYANEAEWNKLDRLLIKVGCCQRALPVHIAREYCQRDGPFFGAYQNYDYRKPIDNWVEYWSHHEPHERTVTCDDWFRHHCYSYSYFPSSLFSDVPWHALLGGNFVRIGEHCCWGRAARIDLAAIEAIDKVRTADFKQSLEDLSQPVILGSELHVSNV